jgi:bifunctional non-homologous end joining protein LigD
MEMTVRKGTDPLATYNAKRDFAKTAEPKGEVGSGADDLFIVQKHDATRLHWDFRLELGGVLKSWAVTRGPSLDPADKRLAVRTEDHPMSYAMFEGTIPKKEYGGGTVMLWDRGTWTPHPGKDPAKTIEEGHLHFTLHGERMKGEWIMIRLKPRPGEKRENWLLRKVEDEEAGASGTLVDTALTSVKTGRTMVEIADGVEAAPLPSTGGAGASPPAVSRVKTPRTSPEGERLKKKKTKRHPLPPFQPPQLATLVDHVPAGPGWLHEVKYDGYRCQLAISGGKAKAYTRTGLDWSDTFAPVVSAAEALDLDGVLLDGEVVALDDKGRPSFRALKTALSNGGDMQFFAFDVLAADGEDLTPLPNIERKARLAALLDGVQPPIHYAEHITGGGEEMFTALCGEGYEGVVSKLADAPYRGRRTQGWVKAKCTRRQEFVIVGWTPSDKARRGFRSLLLGLNGPDGLHYAGKVGTGFDAALMADLLARLEKLEVKTATVDAPRAAVRGAHWVKPTLVAEIAFAEFTDDGVLRHSSFLGLRDDKKAAAVVEEKPAAALKGDGKLAGVKITNPDRVIFPDGRQTKGDLAAFYATVAGPMLGWMADRPVSLVRCPQGRAKHCFFQKHDAGSFGPSVHQVPIREKDGHDEPYLYLNDATGILTCVQMGTIEFHGWGSPVASVENPDRLVFDLDPDEGLAFDDVKRAAYQLRDMLADMGLATFPLLTGGKGLHLVAPLDGSADWPAVKDFADRFARAVAQAHPDHYTANMKKATRKGRIFLDWLRNQRGSTAVMPYSARSRSGAPVAAPITWDELEETKGGNRFTIADADELVKRAGSRVLKGWGVAKQALPAA